MVVLVDLDDADDAQAHLVHRFAPTSTPSPAHAGGVKGDDKRPNPNINGFSAALSCYP